MCTKIGEGTHKHTILRKNCIGCPIFKGKKETIFVMSFLFFFFVFNKLSLFVQLPKTKWNWIGVQMNLTLSEKVG